MSIPKQIMAIWWQGWDKLPEKYKPNVKSVIDKNPGWSYYKWDENSIRQAVKSMGDEYVKKLDSFKLLHQKIDFGRAIILYLFGGVSADIDIVAYKSFDETPHLNDSDFIVSYNSSNALENWIKAGRPVMLNNATILVSEKNPIMKGLIDHMMELSCDIDQANYSCITNTTGPRSFTDYMDKYKDKITILDNVFFEPCPGDDNACEIKPQTITDHQHEGSWVGTGNRIFSQLYYVVKNYWFLFVIMIFIIILSARKSTK